MEARLAFIHDWLTGMRGGEKCLEVLCRQWTQAPLFTLLRRKGAVSAVIEDRPVHTSLLQLLPGVHRYYRYLLPLMPAAANWKIADCDLVLSFSHCVAKAAKAPPGVPHVCYCFTPMRYAWHMEQSYFGGEQGVKARLRGWLLARLRAWDRRTADRVTHFIAISETIRRRIAECYGRDSVVIYPPVDTRFYTPSNAAREDYYLVVSAFAPYKRLDLAIEACEKLGRKLVIIGQGQDERRLRSLAGSLTHFLGWQPDEVIRDHFRRCRALLFPGEEDFGIVPVEAMACGAPVIALGRGGAVETVRPMPGASEPTGILFAESNVEHLIEAIRDLERHRGDFSPQAARRQAVRFDQQRYAEEMRAYLAGVLAGTPLPLAA